MNLGLAIDRKRSLVTDANELEERRLSRQATLVESLWSEHQASHYHDSEHVPEIHGFRKIPEHKKSMKVLASSDDLELRRLRRQEDSINGLEKSHRALNLGLRMQSEVPKPSEIGICEAKPIFRHSNRFATLNKCVVETYEDVSACNHIPQSCVMSSSTYLDVHASLSLKTARTFHDRQQLAKTLISENIEHMLSSTSVEKASFHSKKSAESMEVQSVSSFSIRLFRIH